MSSFVAYGVNSTKPEVEAIYDKAFSAFDEARYDDALNLRGVVYLRQNKFDKAEAALRKAFLLAPKFWNGNLYNVPLYNPAEPLIEPPFAGDEPTTGNERRISPEHLSSSPEGFVEPGCKRTLCPCRRSAFGRDHRPGLDSRGRRTNNVSA